MNGEPDLACPTCGNVMELLTGDEDGSLLRVCPVCAPLAWNGENGKVQTRQPQEITVKSFPSATEMRFPPIRSVMLISES